ncbi:uncharacterized protein F4812DRAFT_64182 [Daldinia caldariorum]|uniref:uncharacterized protein n=1 Tax=Daldinia caldariorum TaxID=326644 RepID=UPI0020074DBA|nr:uncharacterized protein F4812DRAFT_64182 [Daldinia caldariorum]KAI1466736.1 hypothetical protein F4812DRAFT_64182 [Daldinia caldariorum]
MCFFHYPAPKPRHKKAKKQASLRRAVGGEVVHDVAYEAAGEALHQEAAGVGGAAAMMYQPYLNYLPYGVEQYLQDEAGHAARGAWAPPGEALDRALGAADELGKKVEELKGLVGGGVAVAGSAQDTLERTRDDVHHAHAAVKGVDDALRQTHRAIDQHYLEHSTKQDQCAAEIIKVRTMLEEDARDKERARQRHQDMQEAWNYYYQWFRQAEQEAKQKKSSSKSGNSSGSSSSGSSRSGTSSSSSRRSSSKKKKTTSYHGRQTSSTLDDLLYTSSGEARHVPDHRKLRRSVLECLNQILGEAGVRADRPEQDGQNHNHFHAYAPASSPPWAAQYHADPRGWEQQKPQRAPPPQGSAPFPARDDDYYYNNNNDDDSNYDGNGDPGKRNSLRYYQNNPFIHNAGWGGRGPSYH